MKLVFVLCNVVYFLLHLFITSYLLNFLLVLVINFPALADAKSVDDYSITYKSCINMIFA